MALRGLEASAFFCLRFSHCAEMLGLDLRMMSNHMKRSGGRGAGANILGAPAEVPDVWGMSETFQF